MCGNVWMVRSDFTDNDVSIVGDLDPHMSRHTLTPLKLVYKKLRLLVDRGCIFIGHGLSKDFRIISACFAIYDQHLLMAYLDIFVPPDQVIDTVDLYFLKARQRRISLKFLSWFVLHENIQIDTHDSIEDARSTLLLYKAYHEFEEQGIFDQKLEELYKAGRQHVSYISNHILRVIWRWPIRTGSLLYLRVLFLLCLNLEFLMIHHVLHNFWSITVIYCNSLRNSLRGCILLVMLGHRCQPSLHHLRLDMHKIGDLAAEYKMSFCHRTITCTLIAVLEYMSRRIFMKWLIFKCVSAILINLYRTVLNVDHITCIVSHIHTYRENSRSISTHCQLLTHT